MSGLLFAALGVGLFFAIVLPASAIVTRALLAVVSRAAPDALHAHQRLRYGLLLASSALPLAFFVSAGVHQMEWGGCAALCARCHEAVAACPEAALLVAGLLVAVLGLAVRRIVVERAGLRTGQPTAATGAASARLAGLLATDVRLAALADRMVVREAGPPMATHGLLSARISISARFVDALDDQALAAALHHELQHVRGRDPLRYFLASWALLVNPAGHLLLGAELRRWILAREAHCDRGAVAAGASAPALAQALVSAARPLPARAPALGDGDADALRLRVSLLLGYGDRSPAACCQRSTLGWLGCAVALAAALPHLSIATHLDAVHVAADAVGTLVGAGS